MAKENEIPRENLEAMEPTSYADGDFDIGVWQDEIMDMKADDINNGDFRNGDTGDSAENTR